MHFKRVARGRLPVLAFAAIATVYFATAWTGGPARNWHGQTSAYYALLTDAFLAGQTSLLLPPAAELLALPDPYDPVANGPYRLHDASLYHGKYYLYYGPTPAIVLFLPYRVLTGTHLPTRVAVALFCAGGFGFSCALFFRLARREKWDCPPWFAFAAVVTLGTAPGVAFLLTRPSFYEVAIGAGYCFVMEGFLLTAHSLGEDPPHILSLVGAGLCFGLAAGCRPNLALLDILMVLLVAWRFRSRKLGVVAFGGTVALCGVLLAWYNYARFQNPLEFGTHYQLWDAVQSPDSPLSLAKVVPGVYFLLFSPPWFGMHYPFVGPSTNFSAFANLPKGFSLNPTIGLLWLAPVALLSLLMPMLWADRRVKDAVKLGGTRFIIAAVYFSGLGMMALFALLGWIHGRYTLDFAPELVLLSCFLLAALWQGAANWAPWQSRLFKWTVAGSTLYSLLLSFWMCLERWTS